MKRTDSRGGIPTLHTALSDFMNVDDLKKLAALTKEQLPTRKAELVALIERHLADAGLRRVWQRLDGLQRAAVAEVVHSKSPQFETWRFAAKYGGLPIWGTEDARRRRSPSALGFFFYGDDVMPDDLKARLAAFVPKPEDDRIETLTEPPTVYERPYVGWDAEKGRRFEGTEPVPLAIRESEQAAQRELLSVLRLIDAGKVAVSDKTRRPSAATIKTVTGVLDGGDYYPVLPVEDKWSDENAGPIRAFAWPLLVQAGGLAQPFGSKLHLTPAGRKALSASAAETLRALWSRWVGTPLLDELSRIECVKGQTGKGKHGLTAVSARRGAIAALLAECPMGAWIATDELYRFAQASDLDYAVTRDIWNLYLGDPQYGSLGYETSESIVEQRYLLALLLEYAATLGLVDVALVPPARARPDYGALWGTDELVYFSRYDGLIHFRVTPLGAYCLGAAATYEPAPVEVRPVLRVLDTLEIAAIGAELEPGDQLALDAYATRVSEHVWRLEASRLLAALEDGRPPEEIRAFLTARSGTAIPDAVTRLLDETAERSTKVRDCGLARLVECADVVLATLIANNPQTRKHCMPAGERHLVVPSSSEAAFKRALRELGYLVAPGGKVGRG